MNNLFPPQTARNIKGMATEAIGTMKQMGQMATDAEMVMTLISAYKSGNFLPALQQMASQNPKMAQAVSMLQGKDANCLAQMAQNMAAERGTTVDELAKELGLK